MNKKLLFNITEDWFFCSHFLERALAAKKSGYSVYVISKVNKHKEIIENYGFKFISVPFNRKSINLVYEAYILFLIINIYSKVRPDIVHHVAAKPIIYGSIAAKICKIKSVINAPVGMGYVFTSDSIKAKILKPIVKIFLKNFLNNHHGINRRNKVIFENNDDLKYFVELGAVNASDACIIRGAGVSVKEHLKSKKESKVITITLVARMLKDKGVNEFVAAAKKLKYQKVKCRFLLVGDIDPLNPSSLDKKTLVRWNQEEVIEWLGWINNVNSILKQTDILCLPSYREGLPKALVEGAAVGLPIVTTDAVGCREVVEDGLNGFLVPIKNIDELANKISILIRDGSLRKKMGAESFKIARSKFSSNIINTHTLEVYNEMYFKIKDKKKKEILNNKKLS